MLLDHTDLQPALNIDLTDPHGQELADSLIAATQALLSGPTYLGFPIEEAEVTEYRSDGYKRVWLTTTAPVSDLEAAIHRPATNDYDTLDTSSVINHGGRDTLVTASIPKAFHSLRLTYKTGWTGETLPADLKQAIIDIVGLKLQEVANFSSQPPGSSESEGEDESSTEATGALKKVTAGGYTEEFSTAQSDAYWKAKTAQLSRTIGDNLPASILETVRAYRPTFAI